MTAKATTPAPSETPSMVECEDCGKELAPGAKASCRKCVILGIQGAEEEAFEEGKAEGAERVPAHKQIPEWAARRHLMGQISREVREQLELCADDIEVGHG